MAANEKVVYATDWTSYGGTLYRPGQQLSERMPDHALRSARESGLTTDSAGDAKRAADQETQRRADVAEQQARRSEKRDFEPRADRR